MQGFQVPILKLLVQLPLEDGLSVGKLLQGHGRHEVDGVPQESTPLAMIAAVGGSYTEHAQS